MALRPGDVILSCECDEVGWGMVSATTVPVGRFGDNPGTQTNLPQASQAQIIPQLTARINLIRRTAGRIDLVVSQTKLFLGIIVQSCGHERVAHTGPHPELARRRLVVRITETPPNARAIDDVLYQHPRTRRVPHRADYDRTRRETSDQSLRLPLHPVHDGGVVVEQREE
jgi:hypothetical protein